VLQCVAVCCSAQTSANTYENRVCIRVIARSSQSAHDCVAVCCSSQSAHDCVAVCCSSQSAHDCVAVCCSSQSAHDCLQHWITLPHTATQKTPAYTCANPIRIRVVARSSQSAHDCVAVCCSAQTSAYTCANPIRIRVVARSSQSAHDCFLSANHIMGWLRCVGSIKS